tara:strand:+ start:436 stop:897 length:462 start_codon:yes stop_codon:yes gene_type:complete
MKLNPFSRSEPTFEVALDNDSLDRAIRAGVQFPLEWFLSQSPEIQETIASRRDYWMEDWVVAAGYAILDPERTRLALEAEDGSEEAEATLAGLNVRELAEAMGRRAATERPTETRGSNPLSMSGLGERQREATEKREAGRRKKSFFNAEESVK